MQMFDSKNYYFEFKIFMDDLSVSTATHVQGRWFIVSTCVAWVPMKLKPNKSRYM